MRTSLKILVVASALVAGTIAAPTIYAHGSEDTPCSQVSAMGQGGMMGQENTTGQGHMMDKGGMVGHGNMVGQGDMMGHGNMMGQGMNQGGMMGMMRHMMETYGKMMQTMMGAHGDVQADQACEGS